MSRRVYISRLFKFEAAHFLPLHDGKCKHLHGHSYTGEVTISCLIKDIKNGMVMDYGDLKIIMKEVIEDRYDHTKLNAFFENPTAEAMVIVMFSNIKDRIKEPIRLDKISLKETVNSDCYIIHE